MEQVSSDLSIIPGKDRGCSGVFRSKQRKPQSRNLGRSSKANWQIVNIQDVYKRGVQSFLQNKNRLLFVAQGCKSISQTDPSHCLLAVLTMKTNLHPRCLLHPAAVSMSQIYLGEKWLLLKRNTEQKDPGEGITCFEPPCCFHIPQSPHRTPLPGAAVSG